MTFDFSNVPLPFVTQDDCGDVTTIHAITGGKLICSYVAGTSTFACAHDVINTILAPPPPCKIQRIRQARDLFKRDGVLPHLTLTKAYIEGLMLAEAVIASRNSDADIMSLALLISPITKLKEIDAWNL